MLERIEYEAYGKRANFAVNDDLPGYTGRVVDCATGLTYMQQRYYDPGIGMFLSVDPVTAYSNPVGQFHRYRYANNNPYKFTDPDGRQVRGPRDSWPRDDGPWPDPGGCEPYCLGDTAEAVTPSQAKSETSNEQASHRLYAVAKRGLVGHVFVGGIAPGRAPIAFGWYPSSEGGLADAAIDGIGAGELRNDTPLFMDALAGDPNFSMREFFVSPLQYAAAMRTLAEYGNSSDYGVVNNNCVVAAFSALSNAGVTSTILVNLPTHPNSIYEVYDE